MESRLQKYGYEDERFEHTVSPSFHCPICLNVLKEPKMCRNNEHVFCSVCINQHLANSSTCPQCMEELTVETLHRAPRVLMNYLSELTIDCVMSVEVVVRSFGLEIFKLTLSVVGLLP